MEVGRDFISQASRHKVLLGPDSAADSVLAHSLTFYDELSTRLLMLKRELQELSRSWDEEVQRQNEEEERLHASMWRIVPAEPPPKFLCKQKNVEMRFTVVPIREAAFRKEEEVVLKVEVWNQARTRRVQVNLSGEPMVTGGSVNCRYVSQSRGHSGILRFKLHEVSSHFEGGKVCLIISAHLSENPDYESLVLPFVVPSLTIRAKEATCRKDLQRQKARRRG